MVARQSGETRTMLGSNEGLTSSFAAWRLGRRKAIDRVMTKVFPSFPAFAVLEISCFVYIGIEGRDVNVCVFLEYFISEAAHLAKLVMEKGIRARTCVSSSCLSSARAARPLFRWRTPRWLRCSKRMKCCIQQPIRS